MGLVGCQVGRQVAATLHLTATRATQYLELGRVASSSLPPERERHLAKIGHVGSATFRPPFNEVDLVGWVLKVGEPKAAGFQSVYISDRKAFHAKNYLTIKINIRHLVSKEELFILFL